MNGIRTSELDYAQVWENTVTALSNYLEKNKLETMVLGISGGIDSTVVAAIGFEVYKRTGKKLIGLSLMTSTNEADEDYAASLVGAEFCTEYRKCSIETEYKDFKNMCAHINGDGTNISNGNIKARMRMMVLYDAASINCGIVLDTDNISEHELGFFTLKGDEADFCVIAGLWKHEVYEFAKWIKENIYTESVALEKSIALIPTDGNGVAAGGDMGQIAPGCTYNDVDDILFRFISKIEPYYDEITSDKTQRLRPEATKAYVRLQRLNEQYGGDVVEGVIRRHRNSQFKRWHRPLVIDPETGEILQNNGEQINK